ncbi:DinB family protein [Streptomyces samsunensis]|uniref:DinB family protein n=1 Tax=Streptomyces TaxID=1883 RepID=UPI00085302F0|nr:MULTISPECIES: DinB family protein [Streptomyces]MCC4319278.1 DinB family protein [Streptomyces malaysiensis]MCD9590295.1 DinB family protein [Streptomyces sp. 8ZJF_21]NUH36374.1 DinB family protein [Streptomyces samsunensis]
MPVIVSPEACQDERGALLAYLEAQRGGIRRSVYGLTEEQARSVPSASVLSLAGLLKHAVTGERGWLRVLQGKVGDPRDQMAEWERTFEPTEDETVEALLALYDEVARETEEAVRALPSLDETFEALRLPWDEGGTRTWRWAVLHLIEELARHAGHADIIRETIDGKGAFDLVFETGAAPEPDWSILER